MGKGEETSGFLGSKWATIILIVVLVVLAALLYLILGNNERADRFFKRFQKKETKDTGPPLKPVMNDQPQDPGYQPELEVIDSRLRLVAQLSWQKPVALPWA
jgi:hypothetical protein